MEHNIEQFIKDYPLALCDGMMTLIELGYVVVEAENVDEKGFGWTFALSGIDGIIWIKYCPCCGKKIFNVLTPEGECYNTDLPENREKETCEYHGETFDIGGVCPGCVILDGSHITEEEVAAGLGALFCGDCGKPGPECECNE